MNVLVQLVLIVLIERMQMLLPQIQDLAYEMQDFTTRIMEHLHWIVNHATLTAQRALLPEVHLALVEIILMLPPPIPGNDFATQDFMTRTMVHFRWFAIPALKIVQHEILMVRQIVLADLIQMLRPPTRGHAYETQAFLMQIVERHHSTVNHAM